MKTSRVPIDKQHFMNILTFRSVSVEELGESWEVGRSENTIRRQLNAGLMKPELLNEIAEYLNVTTEYLSGQTSPGCLHGVGTGCIVCNWEERWI